MQLAYHRRARRLVGRKSSLTTWLPCMTPIKLSLELGLLISSNSHSTSHVLSSDSPSSESSESAMFKVAFLFKYITFGFKNMPLACFNFLSLDLPSLPLLCSRVATLRLSGAFAQGTSLALHRPPTHLTLDGSRDYYIGPTRQQREQAPADSCPTVPLPLHSFYPGRNLAPPEGYRAHPCFRRNSVKSHCAAPAEVRFESLVFPRSHGCAGTMLGYDTQGI